MLYLLVGINAGCDTQGPAGARVQQRFENIYALPTLHAILRKHRARPTYLITHSVAADARAASVLREMREGRDCEIGAHHLAWDTPPHSDEDVRRRPYAMQLSPDHFAAQVAALTDAITAAVGERPLSYRSGRFGFSASHVCDLERAGYRIESSVAPLFNEAHKGGPDFVGAPPRPYFLAYDDARAPGTSNLLELPVSVALNRRVPAFVERLYGRAPCAGTMRRVLQTLGIARLQWLRPSHSSVADMCALARRMKDDGVPLLNLILRSNEAAAGGSPHDRNGRSIDDWFAGLEQVLAYAVKELGAIPVTYAEFRALYCGTQRAPE
jgi:hypothetical protein